MNELKHIGLLPDGNRRWALERGLDYSSAYRVSAEVLNAFINTVIRLVPELEIITIYLISKRNLHRQRENLKAIIDVLPFFVPKITSTMQEKNIQARIIRTRALLTGNITEDITESFESFYKAALTLEDIQVRTPRYTVNFLVGYDPIEEINQALQEKGLPLSIEDLLVPRRVDLVIRTGGEQKYSEFLPIQAGYAELVFIQKYFQDLREEDITEAINEFRERKRSLGL